MNRYLIFFFGALTISCKSSQSVNNATVIEQGVASWYGPNFHGKKTANGEIYNMNDLTAAHRTLPFNTVVKVVNIQNQKVVEVRINDRGPFAKDRIIDLSKKSAEKIDMIESGTAKVSLSIVGSTGRNLPNNLKMQSFTIQMASFHSRQLAQAKKVEVTGSWIQKVTSNGRQIFRVYYGRYKTSHEASIELQNLKQKGLDGFVKQIEN